MGRTFTLQEANRTLIFVKPVMEDLQKSLLQLADLHQNPHEGFYKEVEACLKKIKYHFEELKQVGCFCRNPDQGWVDFPSFFGEEPIFLTWKLGEESISHWRKLKDEPDTQRDIDETFIAGNFKAPLGVA